MKKEEVGRLTEQRALDTLTEKIESFEIEGNDKEQITLYLYPLQLGRLAMISRRLIDLDLIFDDEQMEGAVKRMWTICSEKSKEVAEIIAIATLRTQQEIEDMLKERTKLIYWSPTMDNFVHHRISILLRGFYERYSLGKNAAGNDFPNDNSGADSHYGGRSIWGQIDNLINRYHWTLEYILWGISWANVQLMISDALKTDCKSKSTTNIPNNEQSKVPDIIDMNDPNAMNTLLLMAGGKR